MDSGPPPPPKTTSDVVDEPPQPGGIGLSIIRAVLEHGNSWIAIFVVPVCYSSSMPATETLKAAFPNARIQTYEGDVRNERIVDAAVDHVDDWKAVKDVNVTGSWLCVQAVGITLFTAPVSGHRVNLPHPQIAYNPSKAAVFQLTRSLPGYHAIWADRNPTCRMADVEELSGAVILLFSKQTGRYINGADIVVYGA
ncbi:hypothetical protein F5878DRAFT_654701 [Lentinula raphanica]|uniref:NAD(P)-binding protein n=1 Tax=Lentinula raphanica TaxID=153919 RepID=A0AA38NX22_9AGAR|nr:hypothetical protein F5878DRAFT_654701 [Lentinula raphanica]